MTVEQITEKINGVLLWFQNWDNLTRIIAIVGFLISIYNLMSGIASQRQNFDIRVYRIKSYRDVTFLHVGIENKSRLSVAITQMILMHGEEKIPCTAVPTLVRTKTLREGKDIVDIKQTFSSPLPITISGLSAQSALVLF